MAQSDGRNNLLALLSKSDLAVLEPHLKPVNLPVRKTLEKPNKRIDAIYFPERGFASVIATQPGGKQVEVGLIGREGMTGIPVVLGNHRSPYSTYIQAAGDGRCIPASEMRKAIRARVSMRDLFLKFVQAFGVQTSQTAVCNAKSKLDERLARWILMAHDRSDIDDLPLTHEFLALMLGVRRPGVTEAINALEKEGLITCARGQITVRNRKGIEQKAGKSYGVPETEYRRLLG